MATWAICNKDRTKKLVLSRTYQKISPRLDETVKAELEWLFNYANTEAGKPLRISRMEFLKKVPTFSNMPGKTIMEVAELLKERRFKSGEVVFKQGWEGYLPVCIIAQGKVSMMDKEKELFQLGKFSIFGDFEDTVTNKRLNEVVAIEESVIYEVEKVKLLEMTKQNHTVIQVLINLVKNNKAKNRILREEENFNQKVIFDSIRK
jgi:signal-transduction protein with cAMP-binding, CBS, and nucleotidyltransferase domain